MKRIGKHIICILWAGFSILLNSQAQPAWPVTTDANPQTIVIHSEILTSDSFAMLEKGDILGAFYAGDRYSNSLCAGKMTWGTENILKIYNDSLTINDPSAVLYFKLWKQSQNCILDSVKGSFRSAINASAVEIAAYDTLYLEALVGMPFVAGYTDTSYCNDRGSVLPKSTPAEYNITYTCDQLAVSAATGEFNLNGSFTGKMDIRFSSNYCLAAPSQSLTILPAPDISFPAETNLCEGVDLNAALNQYVPKQTSGVDSAWISAIDTGIEVSAPTFDYNIQLKNIGCEVEQKVRVTWLPSPSIQPVVDDQCDSVMIHLSTDDGGTIEWSTGLTQDQIYLTSDSRVSVKYTAENGCSNADTLDIKVRKIAITGLDAEEVNADCYTAGKVKLRKIDLVDTVGACDLLLKNMITGEQIPMEGLLKEGRYSVSVVDERGCRADWDEKLIILKDCLNDNPVFSPNSDGMDDEFYISYEGMVYIYDKNGRLIHKFQGPSYWDGTDDRGTRLPLGIYLLVTGSEAKTITILR